jgi:hypothetical protein
MVADQTALLLSVGVVASGVLVYVLSRKIPLVS